MDLRQRFSDSTFKPEFSINFSDAYNIPYSNSFFTFKKTHDSYRFGIYIRHRYDDIIMGFYDKAFDNSLQAKAAGSKPILFPANQNLGRSGLIILRGAFPRARPLSIARHHVVHIAGLNQFSAFSELID